MKIALLSYGAEGLGLQYLSSFLKKNGHEVKLYFDPCLFDDKLLLHYPSLNNLFSFKKKILSEIIAYNPDIVGISILTDTFRWATAYAGKIKELLPYVKIVGGGTHVTILPHRVAETGCFDYLIRGDGEIPFAKLADALAAEDTRTNIEGVWFKTSDGYVQNEIPSLKNDLSCFGNPDRSIYEPYINTNNTLLAISSRGCMFTCSYCHHNAIRKLYKEKGTYLRRLSPECFVGYLRESYEKYQYRTLQIYDEIFTYDVKWLQEFAELYMKYINVPYICLGHPNFMGEEVIRLLKKSKCFGIQIGIQSLNPMVRETFLSRREDDETIKDMIALLEKYRLPYQLDMIFGLPGDKEVDYVEAINFFRNCRAASKINTLILSLQPKTDMVDHAIKLGMISEEDRNRIDSGEEGCRVGEAGSLRDKKQINMIKNYMLMYKIAVKFPKIITDILMISGFFKILRFFEPFIGYVIRIYGVDKRDRLVILHYVRYLTEFFKRIVRVSK